MKNVPHGGHLQDIMTLKLVAYWGESVCKSEKHTLYVIWDLGAV